MAKRDKKQRQKAKRQAKRHEARKRESISPLKRLADAPGELECWISKDDFEGNGQIQVFVYKNAAGLSGLTCFLVDRGVVGLKDAWAKMNIDRSRFKQMLEDCAHRHIPMYRVAPEQARRVVAGGLRWAYDNGMRLPKDWQKTTMLMGGVGDWKTADVSSFVKEFIGHPEDLRQRLISEPLDTYLKRTDISFIFSDSAPYMDHETGEYISNDDSDWEDADDADDFDHFDADDMEITSDDVPDEEIDELLEKFTPSATMLAADTAAWLRARNQSTSPELLEAWRSIMLASMMATLAKPGVSEDENADLTVRFLNDLSARIETAQMADYQKAVDLAMEHLETDPSMMTNAVLKCGMAGEPDEESDES
jgi:hypothetical protein